MAISASDRGQTLHLARVNAMVVDEEMVKFVILSKTKTTKKVLQPLEIKCVSTDDPAVNVCNYVKFYLNETNSFRSGDAASQQFFLSWLTKKAVTKQSLARWLCECLRLADIDTSVYKAHSYRGAGLSAAYHKGASLASIVAQGNWKGTGTFLKHYCAPADDSEIGRIILNEAAED